MGNPLMPWSFRPIFPGRSTLWASLAVGVSLTTGCATTQSQAAGDQPGQMTDPSLPVAAAGGFDLFGALDDAFVLSMQPGGRERAQAKYRTTGGMKPTAEEQFVRIWTTLDRETAYTRFEEMAREARNVNGRFGEGLARLGQTWIYAEWRMPDEANRFMERAKRRLPADYGLIPIVEADLTLNSEEPNQNTMDRAAEAYARALRDHPSSIFITVRMAQAYQRLGFPDRAIQQYERATASNPGILLFWRELGSLQQQLNLTDKAIATFTRAAELDGSDPDLQLRLASLHEQRKDFAAALDRYQNVLRLKPRDNVTARKIVELRRALGQREEEFSALVALLALEPANEQALSRIGELAISLGRVDEAKAYFEQLMGVNDASAEAYYGLALYYQRRDDDRRAIQYISDGLRSKPDDARLAEALRAIKERHKVGAALKAEKPDVLYNRMSERMTQAYLKRLKARPGLVGKLVIAVSFNNDGKVTKAELKENTINDSDLEFLLYATSLEMKLAKGPYAIDFPFNFKPKK
jgi:tetratricopeptide (TPR) repeat protein